MSFLEHLEELRWHILRIVVVIVVLMAVCLSFVQELIEYVVLGPMSPDFPTNRFLCELDPGMCVSNLKVGLQAISPTEQFTRAIFLGIVMGIIAAFPYIVWELWRFVSPGLKVKERRRTRGAVVIVSLLFLVGVSFAYFIMAPFALSFFANFQLTPEVENNWRIGEVISLIAQLCLGGGLLFEMPVLAFVLAKLGMISAPMLRKFRKHAVVFIMILSGVLTPSPDIMSQLLMALPMYILYEVSILVAASVARRSAKAEAAELARLGKPAPNSEGTAEVVETVDERKG